MSGCACSAIFGSRRCDLLMPILVAVTLVLSAEDVERLDLKNLAYADVA